MEKGNDGGENKWGGSEKGGFRKASGVVELFGWDEEWELECGEDKGIGKEGNGDKE